MKDVTQKLISANRNFTKGRRLVVHNQISQAMNKWKDAFVTKHLEQRLVKFNVFKVLVKQV